MTIALSQPINPDVLALDLDQAVEYLLEHLSAAKQLAYDIIQYSGNLAWAEVRRHPTTPEAILVNGEWCENIYCALAYMLVNY